MLAVMIANIEASMFYGTTCIKRIVIGSTYKEIMVPFPSIISMIFRLKSSQPQAILNLLTFEYCNTVSKKLKISDVNPHREKVKKYRPKSVQ